MRHSDAEGRVIMMTLVVLTWVLVSVIAMLDYWYEASHE